MLTFTQTTSCCDHLFNSGKHRLRIWKMVWKEALLRYIHAYIKGKVRPKKHTERDDLFNLEKEKKLIFFFLNLGLDGYQRTAIFSQLSKRHCLHEEQISKF